MGTCCCAHLVTKVRDYARNAQNGAVTVTIIENPEVHFKVVAAGLQSDVTVLGGACDYCKAPAEFTVSYYSK